MSNNADVIILGGGSGGYTCAFSAAQLGLSVILIEQDKIGGTCLHRGCIPTKALLHSAEVADVIAEADRFGINGTLSGVDIDGVHAYKDSVVSKLYKGLSGLVTHHNVRVIQGHGRYLGDRTIAVEGQTFTGDAVVLATGSTPAVPAIFPIGERIVTSDGALVLDRIPQSAVILGGGVIGVEFASVWSSFGTDVTIVEALPRLVSAEDEWSSNQLERAFRRRKIKVRTGTRVERLVPDEARVSVHLDSGEILEPDTVLVAVGRKPQTKDCGFEEAGIELQDGFVVTNSRLETSHPNVFAVGDIVRGLQLAHRGFQQGIFVANQIAGNGRTLPAESTIPRVTYSNPEIASVGLTEESARAKYGEVTTAVYDLAGNGKSQILRSAGGVKLIRAGGKDAVGPIVGVHIVGSRVSELVGEAQLAVGWEAYPQEIAEMVHAHPTLSEAFGEAAMALSGAPLHSH
ncbi:dihydrolipoyl dehydrogenase (plasmid) [Rhodococcus globerulus]|uniref:dihydrolipoyl dehydrogenase n=1 Tax=Rhodococcus globerulus TaxID=33008 RepID=UPI0039EBF109